MKSRFRARCIYLPDLPETVNSKVSFLPYYVADAEIGLSIADITMMSFYINVIFVYSCHFSEVKILPYVSAASRNVGER